MISWNIAMPPTVKTTSLLRRWSPPPPRPGRRGDRARGRALRACGSHKRTVPPSSPEITRPSPVTANASTSPSWRPSSRPGSPGCGGPTIAPSRHRRRRSPAPRRSPPPPAPNRRGGRARGPGHRACGGPTTAPSRHAAGDHAPLAGHRQPAHRAVVVAELAAGVSGRAGPTTAPSGHRRRRSRAPRRSPPTRAPSRRGGRARGRGLRACGGPTNAPSRQCRRRSPALRRSPPTPPPRRRGGRVRLRGSS